MVVGTQHSVMTGRNLPGIVALTLKTYCSVTIIRKISNHMGHISLKEISPKRNNQDTFSLGF